MTKRGIAKTVALAITESCGVAGQEWSVDEPQSSRVRASNLVKNGYVLAGDPYEWGGRGVVATILMEPRGGQGDCQIPLEYYGEGMDVSFKASERLGDAYIEFVNPAVACVYPA